jgi:hypothetical protein
MYVGGRSVGIVLLVSWLLSYDPERRTLMPSPPAQDGRPW